MVTVGGTKTRVVSGPPRDCVLPEEGVRLATVACSLYTEGWPLVDCSREGVGEASPAGYSCSRKGVDEAGPAENLY